jgi:hypothetical protein
LALNGGTINDSAGNSATLTLPTPGATGSLGANKAFAIDGTAPTVTEVTSTTAAGSYMAGDDISIQVVFSEAVTVAGGTPTLTLATGGAGTAVNYASGSGSTTLTFTYTVGAGETASDLNYSATTSLAAAGGATIKDTAGNSATLTLPATGSTDSLAGNEALVVDTTVPTVTNITSTTAMEQLLQLMWFQ